jgi:hypothetical protein
MRIKAHTPSIILNFWILALAMLQLIPSFDWAMHLIVL